MSEITSRLPRIYHTGRDVSRREGTTSQSRLVVEDPMAAAPGEPQLVKRSPLRAPTEFERSRAARRLTLA